MGSFTVRTALCLGICLSVLVIACQGQTGLEDGTQSQQEQYPQQRYAARELVDALEGLLENSSDTIAAEKKGSQIPRCAVGERCALKYGPRIGKLCDCLQGAACNTFLLRCY